MNDSFLIINTIKNLKPDYITLIKKVSCFVYYELDKFANRYKFYDDHSVTHSLRVLENADNLIRNNIKLLNAEELLILALAVFTHDLGMTIDDSFYDKYANQVIDANYIKRNPNKIKNEYIRKFHNEFSAKFLLEKQPLKNFLSKSVANAVGLLCKGHRNYDLNDLNMFPDNYKLYDKNFNIGSTINIAYLAPLLRLADELDATEERSHYSNYKNNEPYFASLIECKKNIKSISYDDSTIYVNFDKVPDDKYFLEELKKVMFSEFTYCRDCIKRNTKFKIQDEIKFVFN